MQPAPLAVSGYSAYIPLMMPGSISCSFCLILLACPSRHRFLARGRDPALEFAKPILPRAARTPILFVHRAFGGAWTWTELFVLRAAKRGRPSVAFSVRGHGRSEGRDFLRSATLTDYTDDLRRTLAQFVAPAIGVAHSLGALLAQRLLGHVSTRAMIMLAPSPAEGLSILGPRPGRPFLEQDRVLVT
jgi:pimeloyl-ACP methyl ester carboxylesterase